jgi:hypothetical protein
MYKKIGKHIVLTLMFLNGILFMIGIYVLGNTQAAYQMHEDMPPTAGDFLLNFKIISGFIVGAMYVISAIGIYRNKLKLALAGVLAFILFDGFYLVEILLWGKTHTTVWVGFGIFGTLSLLFGIFSWFSWKSVRMKNPTGI